MVATFVGFAFMNFLGTPWVAVQDAQSEEAPKKPMLQRVYKAGDKQDYKFTVVANTPEGELNISGSYSETVKSILDNGLAEVESKTTNLKMMFGGAETPSGDDPPAMTNKCDKFGMPTDIKSEDLDPFSAPVMFAQYLPAMEIDNPGSFKLALKIGDFSIDGVAKLIATGRLYEERVAKIEYEFTLTPQEGAPGKFQFTTYLNLFSGKLVKSEGAGTIDDPDAGKMTIKFAVDKVRG